MAPEMAADLRITMHEFKIDTIKAMQTILEEVCRHIPSNSSAARTFVATKILECAGSGDQTYEGLLAAGRRAVIDLFGSSMRFGVRLGEKTS
jgi:hypothetical protein